MSSPVKGITMIERIPVEMNLGQPEQIIGWASATKHPESGQIIIELVLDEIASGKLETLVEMLEIRAIGFAGIKRRPQDGR